MINKKILALPIVILAANNYAEASAIVGGATELYPGTTLHLPNISLNGRNTPSYGSDYGFNESGLNVRIQQAGNSYVLTASGTGSLTFFEPNFSNTYAGKHTSFNLSYTFNKNGTPATVSSGADVLTITSTLSQSPAGATGSLPSNHVLFSAPLTGFNFDPATGALGFATDFTHNTSWAVSQSVFTGGSTGESVYLFDSTALDNGRNSRLAQLITAFEAGDLGGLPTSNAGSVDVTYSSVEALLSLPIPSPAALFGVGLTALFGLKQRKSAK